ncbi:hypothetical protein MLD38_038678 [Melastoma candidum]|uniref:Uncharacterized protein n=1 Tax=Melastoma candidum TaxID=119954 RepID=A0ACB9KZN4_9MYRT|nr:hypothetical protein MLD38_038678 [Melastoma candidum]
MSRGASVSDHVGVADGDDPVGRIVSELIDQFRSVGRPLRFYEVEEKLLGSVGKLRFPAEKLEKEKALLRERLEVMSNEKSSLESDVRKMRDCLELSGVFSRLGWSGEVNAADMTGEEIYDAMLRQLMSRNGEDLTEVVDHLRRKVEELERDSQDSEMLKRENAELKKKWDKGSCEVGELNRKVNELEMEKEELERDSQDSEMLKRENAELKKKWDMGSCEVGELNRKVNELEMEKVELKRVVGDMRQRIVVLEMDNEMLTEKVGGSSCDAELKRVKEELKMANAMLKVKAERSSPNYGELSRKIEELKADNKELKMNLEQNVAKRRCRIEDAELQYQNLKRELDESKRICKGLERKNEVAQSNFDELVQENEKLEKKIGFWKNNYEELQKRVIVLEKDVDELKSCDVSVLGPKDHCSDEKFASTNKNGKHSIELTRMLSDNGVCSVAGDSTPISDRVVDLMDSDDNAAVLVPPVEKRQSPDSLGKEPLPTFRVGLKRKSDAFIDLTQNEDNIDEGDGLCRSSSRARNEKRSKLGARGEKMDGSPGSTRSSSTLLH